MGRQRQPQIRQRLLVACTDYSLEHGLPDRLEPLANAPGPTSPIQNKHIGTRYRLHPEIQKRFEICDIREKFCF